MSETIKVNLPIDRVVELIDTAVVENSFSGEKIDTYSLNGPNNTHLVNLIYEKHYYRAGNRLTLTVTIDDFEGITRVHYIGAGGGEGLFGFDWGAGDSFTNVVTDALESFMIL